MNPYSGHLMEVQNDYIPTNYESIPQELNSEARKELGGRQETYVSLNSSSPLSDWARQKRTDRNKQAKVSRKQNRRK
jgi:hypothetical protein